MDQVNAEDYLILPPLRTFNDFVLDSSLYQLPDFNNWNQCGQRMFHNLLYYQSNYLLIIVVFYGRMLMTSPVSTIGILIFQAMTIGLIVVSAITIIVIDIGTFGLSRLRIIRNNPISKWAILGFALLMLSWLFLPYTLVIAHALLHIENPRMNDVSTVESLSKYTPLGIFISLLRISSVFVRER